MLTIILYVWGMLGILLIVFVFAGIIIENFANENSSVMKWWRKYIIGIDEKDDYN